MPAAFGDPWRPSTRPEPIFKADSRAFCIGRLSKPTFRDASRAGSLLPLPSTVLVEWMHGTGLPQLSQCDSRSACTRHLGSPRRERAIEDIVEKIRENHRELADSGALPALVFIQLSGRVTDRDARLRHPREHDRLTDPADDEDHHDTGLLHDALLLPVEYARHDGDDAPVAFLPYSSTSLSAPFARSSLAADDSASRLIAPSRSSHWAATRASHSVAASSRSGRTA